MLCEGKEMGDGNEIQKRCERNRNGDENKEGIKHGNKNEKGNRHWNENANEKGSASTRPEGTCDERGMQHWKL